LKYCTAIRLILEKFPIAERSARENDWTIEYAVSILEQIKIGIIETIQEQWQTLKKLIELAIPMN
jgi:hypothetical protein